MPKSASNLPQGLFFDLDGTLLDSLPGIAFSIEQSFKSCGLQMQPLNLLKTIGPPIATILSLAAPQATELERDLLERIFRTSYDSEGWKKTLAFPGANAMLKQAFALGIPLFVVSNKPRDVSIKILEREGILQLFLEVVTRDSREPLYPTKAHMIEHLIHAFELNPSRCVMVGDTMEDAQAAASTQVSFTWVAHGYGELSPNQSIAYQIQSFSELLPMLTREFTQ
ncbi:MAG: HAD family hydrolase [Acidobacteriaceae bacterium]